MYLTESTSEIMSLPQSTPVQTRFVFTNQIAECESSDHSSTVIEMPGSRSHQPKRPRHFQARGRCQSPGGMMTFKNTNALCGDLEKLLNLPEMCDIKFLVGKTKTPVFGVKAILATRNRTFFSMILSKQKCIVHADNNPTSSAAPKKSSFLAMIRDRLARRAHMRHLVIEVPEFDPISFRKVITYLQTGDIKVDISDAIGVMNAADTYGLEDLREACFRFSRKSCSVKTVFKLVKSAEAYWTFKWTKLLMNEIIKFISRRASKVLESKEFSTLSQESAVMILTSEDLFASDEKKWDTAFRWAKRQCCQKDKKLMKSTLRQLTTRINFCNIPQKKLLNEVKPFSVIPDVALKEVIAHISRSPVVIGQDNSKRAKDPQMSKRPNQNGQINHVFTCCSSESLTTPREELSPKSLYSEGGYVLTSESSLLI